MILFRIDKTTRTTSLEAFNGEGAFKIAGRWNHKGLRAVYCSDSLALACLEKLVHLESPRTFPKSVFYVLNLPDHHIEQLATLPPDWRAVVAGEAARKAGSDFLRSNRAVGLQVPSAIIATEFNMLVNVAHPDFQLSWVQGPELFDFDGRLT